MFRDTVSHCQYNIIHCQFANTKASRKKFQEENLCLARYDYVKKPLFIETAEGNDGNKSISRKHYGRISHSTTI